MRPRPHRVTALRALAAIIGALAAWGVLHRVAPGDGGHGPASLLPPLLAVAVALATQRVITALSVAIITGALIATGLSPLDALESLATSVVGPAIADLDNLYVVGFALCLVAMVRVLTATGALSHLMRPFSRLAHTRRGAQGAAAAMGCAVFFDDYANALVVGAAARPLTDAKRVSREKLTWIVDATSAPIAGLVIVSTWVAYEIKLFDASAEHYVAYASSGFDLLLTSLPYRFYCIFSLAFVWMLVLSGRDYGPMLRAEQRAVTTGRVHPDPAGGTEVRAGAPRAVRWTAWLALTAIGIVILGGLASAVAIFEDALLTLFLASVASLAIALAGAIAGRLLPLPDLKDELRATLAQVLPLLLILILAFSLRNTANELGTNAYLASLAADVPVGLLPVTTFGLAAAIAFATGTSWGTMGILVPLAIPLAAELTVHHPDAGLILLLVAASVLDGAIFGDHCSLISDTTIMSAVACDCPVVDHFRTQVPYTLPPMLAATLPGYALLGLAPDTPWILSFSLGLALAAMLVITFGKRATALPQAPLA